jgi:TATA-box binding protein (TBP) (component of TFIID and TFIIIB)
MEGNKDYSINIQRVVAENKLDTKVDTDNVRDRLEDVISDESYLWMDYGPPALYYEVDGDDGSQVTIHESGSYCIRDESEQQIFETEVRFLEELKRAGVIDEVKIEKEDDTSKATIENVVALAKLDRELHLRALNPALGDDSQYEPEVFPAVEYSTSEYPCSFLIYGNGNIVIAGASRVKQVEEAMSKFYDELDEKYMDVVDMYK